MCIRSMNVVMECGDDLILLPVTEGDTKRIIECLEQELDTGQFDKESGVHTEKSDDVWTQKC